MGNCTKLKWNRRRLGLTQQQFADKVGVSVGTIRKLETDETAWATIRDETQDKICTLFESMSSWQPERADDVMRQINDSYEAPAMEVVESKPVFESEQVFEVYDGLTANDRKTLSLLEFAYEGLTQATTHADFVANINLINRMLKKY